MGLKCGLFPVSLTWAPGMALLEDTYGKRLAPYGASFLQRVAPNEFFQDSGQATTLQKQRDCGLRCWVGSAARGGPRRGWGDAAPRARRREGRIAEAGRDVHRKMASAENAERTALAHLQDDLADVFAALEDGVRVGGALDRQDGVDGRDDLARLELRPDVADEPSEERRLLLRTALAEHAPLERDADVAIVASAWLWPMPICAILTGFMAGSGQRGAS